MKQHSQSAISRSLGDRRLKRGGEHATKGVSLVIPTPDVTSFALGREQRFLLLGCDGLLLHCSSRFCCGLVVGTSRGCICWKNDY